MKRKAVLGMMIIILVTISLVPMFNIQPVKAEPATIVVPDDYPTIQEAINAANASDTIFVYNGTYLENVVVNKSVSLIGENKFITVIDGNASGNVLRVTASNVVIRSFTIQKSGNSTIEVSGISLFKVLNTTIYDNIIKNNNIGIHLRGSNKTRILDNIIADNMWQGIGIQLLDNDYFNNIVGNTLRNNSIGIAISTDTVSNNIFYRNNFVENRLQVNILGLAPNKWDNGVEGNYWSDYDGVDLDGDGIGDTAWGIDGKPLVEPWSQIRTYKVNSDIVVIDCNFTIASFKFNQTLKQINFHITGPPEWPGFCNITIPKIVLNATLEPWKVFLGNQNITENVEIKDNSTHTSFYFANTIAGNTAWIIAGFYLPPKAAFDSNPKEPRVGEPISFIDGSTDVEGNVDPWIDSWFWDFGDNTNSSASSPIHKYAHVGNYTVTLTVHDAIGLNNATSEVVAIKKMETKILLFGSSEAKAGSLIVITAKLESEIGQPLAERTIIFRLSGEALEKSKVTNASGFASFLIYFMAGTYTIIASFEGDLDFYESNSSWTVTMNPLNTTLSMPTNINATQREPVALSATLRDEENNPVKEVSVDFYFYNGTMLEKIGSSQTNNNGVASLEYTPPQVGTYQLLAMFRGGGIYSGSNTTGVLTVAPKAEGVNYTPYIVLSVLVFLVGALGIKVLRKPRPPHAWKSMKSASFRVD